YQMLSPCLLLRHGSSRYPCALSLHDALPIFSTRREMDGLATALAESFQTITADWPGFREGPKPAVKWTPSHLVAFLDALLAQARSEEHTSELQSRENLVCRLLLEKKNKIFKK